MGIHQVLVGRPRLGLHCAGRSPAEHVVKGNHMKSARLARARAAAIAIAGIASLAVALPTASAKDPSLREGVNLKRNQTYSAQGAVALDSRHAAVKSLTGSSSAAASTAAAASLPTDCGLVFHRAANTSMGEYFLRGSKFSGYGVGRIYLNGAPAQPDAMGFVRVLSQEPYVEQYVATYQGALHNVEVRWGSSGASIESALISPTGWAGVREIAGGGTGRIYALNTAGSVVRYVISPQGAVSGVRTVGASGWLNVYSLAPAGGGTFNGRAVDGFLAITKSGALNEYLFRTDGSGYNGFQLRSTGWAGFNHISVGSCASTMRPIVGINRIGDVYAYRDYNGSNLSGADIAAVGKVGSGMLGLLFD